jgi:hypothetical protein
VLRTIDAYYLVLQPTNAVVTHEFVVLRSYFPLLQLMAEKFIEQWLKQKLSAGFD